MKKTDYNKRLFTLISILVSVFVYTGAVAIYFYANGWRLDPMGEIFIKTGVLTVESDPFLANLYINGEQEGRTPKSVSLPVGKYDVSVYRSEYVEWKKEIEVKEEKSTPVYPWLIKERIEKSNIFTLQDKEYIDSWISKSENYIYFATKYPTLLEDVYRYEIYRFDINTEFWDLSSNPKIVLTFDSTKDTKVSLSLSPNGLLGVLDITEEENKKYYLLDSNIQSNLDSLEVLNINSFSSYEMSWSLNNQYLMFDSKSDLISYDINKQTRYLLLKKEKEREYIWSTDEEGFFYKVDINTENTDERVYSYLLIQQNMDGSNSKTLVDDMYFQKERKYIDGYKEDTGDGKYAPFTNSPQSTKSVGEVQSIRVNQKAKGIYIGTDTSSYWYSISNGKYYLISPYSSQLITFAPDFMKLIFKDTQGYSVFTFLKENGDHTVEIGSKKILGINTKTTNIHWLSNSSYIWYVKDNSMYIADMDGENIVEILKDMSTYEHFVITVSNEKVYTFYVEDIDSTKSINIDSHILR